VLDEVGAFDERLTNADDWDLWLRVARRHPLGLIDQPLVAYHVRRGNISSRGRRLYPAELFVLEQQLPHAADADTRRAIRHHLAYRYGSLAWALKQEGEGAAARTNYRKSLANELSWGAMRGWLLSWVQGRREQP
jgi:hypothetical protein